VRRREDRQAEPPEILVEREARRAVEQGRDHDEGDGVAEGEAMVPAIPPKDIEGRVPHVGAVVDEMEAGTELIHERERGSIADAVAQERGRLADDVPCRPQRDAGRRSLANEITGLQMVRVGRVQTGVEERGITEDPRWQAQVVPPQALRP
jgi:hypothetical protein